MKDDAMQRPIVVRGVALMREAGAARCYLLRVIDKRLFDELNERISQAMRDSPAADIEKNLRALLAAWFDQLNLVSREDFDVQRRLLERAQAKLAELETRLAQLEARSHRPGAGQAE